MSDLTEFLYLTAAVVVALTTVGGAFLWLIQPRVKDYIEKVTETNRMVTQNGHKNPAVPTLPDRLADLTDKLDEHLKWSEGIAKEHGERIANLEGQQEAAHHAAPE